MSRAKAPATQKTRNSSNFSEASSDDTTQGSQRVQVTKKKEKQNDGTIGLKFDRNSLDQMYSTSQNLRNELDKKIAEQKEKYGFSINKKDFLSIEFDNGWPLIVKDIVFQLTGMDLLKSTIIREADELPSNSFIPPNGWFEDSELNAWRPSTGCFTQKQYAYILHTFRCFMGVETRIEDAKQRDDIVNTYTMGNISENQIYLEEKDIVNNFARVFGYDCPYFGKILYLFLSSGQHRMKIDFLKMIKALYPIFNKDN